MPYFRALIFILLAALSSAVFAVTVAPFFSSAYTAYDLGSIAGLPNSYGGLIVKDGDTNTLLIGGQANSSSGRIYAVPVTRDAGGHIASFGTPVAQGYGANNDGGIAYGPGGVLFYSKYNINQVGQVKPGSNSDDKVVQLAPLSIATSTGALNFVPPGFGGAGRLKIGSYSGGQFYDVSFSADATGTYNLLSASLKTTIPGGPEGFVYVPSGSPVFSGQNILFTLYGQNKVVAYAVDAEGNPTGAPQDFVTGLNGGEGATIDPLTGDFLFSTFGASNRVIQVRGFRPPPPPATTVLTSSANPSLEGLNVIFTATVTGNSPTGTVTFKSDGADLPGCVGIALSTGLAACNTATLAQGSRLITALYSGDGNNGSSNGNLTQVVNPATLSVSATAPGGGGYVLCEPSSVSPGGNSTCIATPDPGYQVQSWNGACASWSNHPRCYLYNIQSGQVSTVSFSPLPTYTVNALVVGGNGTVSCAPGLVISGQSSTCTAVPDPGFQIQSWTGACAATISNPQCYLNGIRVDQTSTVSFEPTPPVPFTVSATAPGGGGYVLCEPSSVSPGGNSTCIATPDPGYQVQAWGGDCASWTSNSRCYLYNIQSDRVSTVSFSPLPTYTVSATVVGGNGTVSCTPGLVVSDHGSLCTAVPSPGFKVQSWSGACASTGSNPQCHLNNIQSDQTSTVSFVPIPSATYTISASVTGGNGAVSCLPSTVLAGQNSSCYAVPLVGYQVQGWTGACAAAGSNVQCALTNIQTDQNSTVSFTPIPPATYTVSAAVIGGNGSVSCLPGSVQAGQGSVCYAVPYAGYQVQSWTGACASWSTNPQCTLTNIQSNQKATVSFAPIPPATFTVTASVVGGNGSVSCLPTSVIAGQNSVCYAVPYAGFEVQGWTGDCAAAGNAGQCDLTNIQTDLTSTVSFVPIPLPTYTVSATVASGNGTVSCAPASVTKGASSSCTAVPALGYQVTGWTGACNTTGANNQCFLPKIQADKVSTVSFGPVPPATYSVSASVVLGHGSVSCTPGTVTAGGSSACAAVPDTGYQVQSWGGACASWGHNAQCSLTQIQADQFATVGFAPLPPSTYTVSATVEGGNGVVSCTPGTVTAGSSSACTAVPAVGYQVAGWSGACAATGANLLCDLTGIQSDRRSAVSFVALPLPSYTVSATVSAGNGTVSCAPSPVTQGGASRCTAIPAPGYVVAGWGGACAATGPNLQCGLTNIQDNQDSTVSFSAIPVNTYHISATVVLGNGSVSCTPTTVAKGGQSTCIAAPDTGWQVQNWGGACAVSGSDVECFLPKIRRDEAATVSFAPILPQTYTVTATVIGGNGSMTCNPSPVARKGQSTCTALPDPGYQVQSWGGDCTNVLPSLQCYFSKIERNLQSTVSYSAVPVNHYTVRAVVIGGHGTVSCAPTSVTAGQSSICSALPEAGYQLQHWDGACLLAGTNAQCALTNIQTDQSSTVSFALIPPITYTVTVTATVASGSGSVNCVPSPVVKGGSSSCTALPAAGWQVSGWTGACAATGANAQCYLPKVQKNENATVSFVPLPQNTYSVSAIVAVGLGSVTCSPGSVASGGASICTATPADGYQVSGWGGACSSWASNAQCYLTKIKSNQVSAVSFMLLPVNAYTISATVESGNGTLSCTPTSVSAGGTITCTAVPEPGYQIANWTGACAAAGKNATCVISNVSSNQVASVNLVKATPPPNPIPLLPIWGAALMGLGLLAAARRRF